MKVLFLRGLPGSGKSTFALEFMKGKRDWVRVNRDDLRNMEGDYDQPKKEGLISIWEQCVIESSLQAGYNILVDATNLNPRHFNILHTLAEKYTKDIEIKEFKLPLEECIARDSRRLKPVGGKVIRSMWEKYYKPEPPKYNPALPDCIIVDIDGTVADKGSRSAYDETKVLEDKPREKVLDVIWAILQDREFNIDLIFMSGRHETCRENTEKWIDRWNGKNYKLFMRGADDNRDDRIVKRELYEAHIKDKYNVYLVFDDRNRVVNMWRNELGLEVFQVADGDF